MYQVRSWLSAQISPLHEEVDRRCAIFELSAESGADALTRFLAIGVHAVENGLNEANAAEVLPEYPARRRAHLMPAPADRHTVPFASDAEIWGALYVLEGSRLGGRWLAKQSSYLRQNPFFAKDEPVFWPVFLSRLDAAAERGVDAAGIRAGAEAAFGAFLRVDPSAIGDVAFVTGGRSVREPELVA